MLTGRDRLWWLARLWSATVLVILTIKFPSAYTKSDSDYRKVCLGSQSASNLEHGPSSQKRYSMLKKQYSNCTHVSGNLVIQFLEEEGDFDMGFLKDIQEVSGYVYIVGNFFSYLNLTSLRVIRGEPLYIMNNSSRQAYSLVVTLNFKKGSSTVGLKQLGMVSLQEIMAGGVYFYNNNMLCYEETINWNDIKMDESAEIVFKSTDTDAASRRICNQCHPNCTYGGDQHCWGDGPDMCQTLSKVLCSKQCESRCFGPAPNECCRPECAGGCSGPLKTDCFACKNFVNDGSCVEQCPPMFIYQDYKWVPNPGAKYAYGNLCVQECPEHLIADRGACVSDCSEGHKAENRKCVPCNGPCPKTCPGNGENEHLNSQNIHNFTGCTIINGNLKILQSTFSGDPPRNISGINIEDLSVFECLQEITEYLMIQGTHEQFTNLSFLRNLVSIQARKLDRYNRPFQVVGTSLTFLGLHSLKEILNSSPLISGNLNLCYVSSMNWSGIVKTTGSARLSKNKNETLCEEEGKVCSPLCSSEGCWGPGDDQCLNCTGYWLGKRCIASCEEFDGWFAVEENGTRECRKCHSECKHSCSREGADQCDSCRHVKDGPYCVAECPLFKYPNAKGICEDCHKNCHGGCTGPENTVGPGACNACSVVVYDGMPLLPVKCLRPESDCEVGYYFQYIISANSRTEKHKACYRCHPECTVCTGGDISFCSLDSCVHFVEGQRCVSNCSSNHYAVLTTHKCHICDSHCLRCHGPTSSDCISCRQLKAYKDFENRETNHSFSCVDDCPASEPNHYTDPGEGQRDTVCVPEGYGDASSSSQKTTGLAVGITVGVIVLVIAVTVIVFFCLKRQTARSEENKLRLAAKLTGMDECEPLNPSLAKPDMSLLRLIKESELVRDNIIGSGAFGTVYKGAWKPSGENVKIPVAIKVLQESSPSQNKELLEEARIMASVIHRCCVRILAVCMTAQMMLVTQLMPFGCLLEYVRKNQMNIGSKVLLNWSTQIAKGMKYLESLGIVHRDLAARNVLVESATQVKITDFGLAKLLDYNQEQFQAAGGKMPIKWLALECIQHRIFTHKSDVWSFGVTMWELYTYGLRPYENILARDIPSLLEKGERLPQPPICTIDVYMIMIKCWMLDAESRPSFHELEIEYAKMARDPGRYLVIQGDELMKLPEHKYETKDLLTGSDGPEAILSADEYLQPQQPTHDVSQYTSMQGSKRKKGRNSNYSMLSSSPESSALTSPGQRHSGLETGPGHKRGKHTNSRYSADPCKVLGNGPPEYQKDWSSRNSDVTDGARQQPSSLDLPVKLPVGDDDYLQPSLSSPSTYVEVIDSDNENTMQKPSGTSTFKPNIADNPEYFDDTANAKKSQPLNNQPQQPKFRNLSSGSEAEYYNEQDGLNVRNKPSHKFDSRPYNESEV